MVSIAAPRWPAVLSSVTVPTLSLAGCRRLIVVAAHPDDETLGAGTLLASATAAGLDVTVIVATRGEGSHPDSPTHTRADLVAIRRSEFEAAIRVVAPGARLVRLGLPDGALQRHREALVSATLAAVGAGGADSWLVAHYRSDGHPDHEAVGHAAAVVAAQRDVVLLEYPLWCWVWTEPADARIPVERLVRLAGAPAGQLPVGTTLKDRALAAYRSQLEPLSAAPGDEAVVPRRLLDHLAGAGELFVADPPGGAHATATAAPATEREGTVVTMSGDYFERLYTELDDPWHFTTSWYERRKRDLTLAALPKPHFDSAFEPGCSIGTLTTGLAGRCRRLLAADVSAVALAKAAQRLAGDGHVELRRMQVPADWPDGPFDLIVLSEMAYYLGDADLDELVERVLASLTGDGALVACHWRHPVRDYPQTGDAVHLRLRAEPRLALLSEHIEADFRLDVLVRPPAVSIATAEGKTG